MVPHDVSAAGSASILIADLTRLLWQAIALGLAYGLLSMALIQLLKDMYLQRAFNRKEFNRWFPSTQSFSPRRIDRPSRHGGPRQDLLSLAAAGDEDALFGLPINKMAGQINVAANAVIESPSEHPQLLERLATGADEKDIDLLIDTNPASLRPSDTNSTAKDSELRFAYADARTRVGHQIQRTIDVLQLSASQRWTRLNRWLSLLFSFILGFAPIYLRVWLQRRYGFFATTTLVPASIFLSLIGGCLAPLLRDLTVRQARTD